MLLSLACLSLLASAKAYGDFVDVVECTARGIEITLKKQLPTPRGGNWDLAVAGFPKCPGGSKTDVGGGHAFEIRFADKQLCGVDANSMLTPAWVSHADAVLTLTDDNRTQIADSVSCVYDTRFETSLLTFEGEITNQNLRFGGSLAEDGADVETMVYSSEAIQMDFFDQVGRPLQQRSVQLGDPIMFKIDVARSKQVTKVLPENCYFSSSSIPEENVLGGETLSFVKKSCFNSKDGVVRAFLPKMERNGNGTTYEMRFPAFHFTGHGRNLFVHCTILACVGSQRICDPKSECFGVSRRKRDLAYDGGRSGRGADDAKQQMSEAVFTRFIVVDDKRGGDRLGVGQWAQQADMSVCLTAANALLLTAATLAVLVGMLVVTSCMAGRLISANKQRRQEKRLLYAGVFGAHQPPTYSASLTNLPSVTSF